MTRPEPVVLSSLLLVLLLPLTLQAQDAPSGAFHLQGQVLDGTRGEAPLGGAIVLLEELGRTARTDGNGAFEFADVPEGLWSLRVQAESFHPSSQEVDLRGDPGRPVAVVLTLMDRIFALEGVVASVSPLRNPVGYQPAQALDRDELTRRLGPSMGTMLDGEPGVAMRSLGPAPARPVIRGFDGDRVLVLENGERMGDLAETAADHALSLDPLAVRRVEVIRGPASLLYGASALGGVVNLFTGDLPDTWARGWSGSLATQGATVNRSGAVGGDVLLGGREWAGTGRLSIREAGDLRTPEARLLGTGLSSVDGQVGAVRERGGLRVGGSVSFLDRSYGIPESVDDHDQEVEIAMERQALQGRLDWTPAETGWVEGVEVRINSARFFQQEFEREFGVAVAGGDSRVLLEEDVELEFLQYGGTFTTTMRHGGLGPIQEGALGVALRARNLEVGGDEAFTPGAREGTVGLFAFQEIPLAEGVRLQFGVRGEGQRSRTLPNDDFPMAEGRRSSLALSGSVGLNWRPGPGWELGGQLARAHRNPSVEELFANGPHLAAGAFEVGTPELADEVGHGIDLFLRHGSERFSVEVATFLNQISRFVAFQPTGRVDEASNLPIFNYEATDARMLGGEATLSASLTPELKVAAGVDYVRGERVESGTPTAPLPTIPPLRGRLELRWDGEPIQLGLTSRVVAAQRRVAPEEESTGGYLLLDLDAGYRLDPEGRHILILRVENATNRLYRDHLSRVEERGFPMPARNLSLVYRLSF